MTTFAEYLIENLNPTNVEWRNKLYGVVHDLPSSYNQLVPSAIITKSDLLIDRRIARIKSLLTASLKRQGIIAFMSLIMQIDARETDLVVNRMNELLAVASNPQQLLSTWRDYIFPNFDYSFCTHDEISELFAFFKIALMTAISSEADVCISESGQYICGLNLTDFQYEKLHVKLKVHVINQIGADVYKARLAIATEINNTARHMTENLDTIVKWHPSPAHYQWELYGFTNMYQIADKLMNEFPQIPNAAILKPRIIAGLYDAGLIFIRNDQLEYLIRHLYKNIKFEQIQNEIANALNTHFLESVTSKAETEKTIRQGIFANKNRSDSDTPSPMVISARADSDDLESRQSSEYQFKQ